MFCEDGLLLLGTYNTKIEQKNETLVIVTYKISSE